MAIVLALISAVVYGTSDYLGGRAARTAPLLAVTLAAQTTTLTLSLVLVAIRADPFPGAGDVGWSAGAGLMSLIAIVAFYEALAEGAMTVVAPTTAVISAIVPVVVGVASGERPAGVGLVGIALAVVAVALVSGATRRAERPTPSRIVALAFVAGVGFGLLFVFLDRTSDDSGLWPLCIAQLTAYPLVVVLVLARRVPLRGVRNSLALAVAAGVLGITANVSYLLATRRGLLSLVAVITSMYPSTTVALATTLDGERLTRAQVVGLALAVTAVVMISLGT